MAGPEFFQTVMGRAFYEGTVPALVKELKKLNVNLEKLIEVSVYGSPKGTEIETCGKCGAPLANKGLCKCEDQAHTAPETQGQEP